MDTCVRGFSFMADSKTDLQYIEDGELERTWRSTRRERMKKREQSIWDSFVKEKDAVQSVCSDDPYQFLEPLPESCIREIMEDEQPNLMNETTEDEGRAKRQNEKEQVQKSTGDNYSGEEAQTTCVVTFAEDMEKENSEMFYLFDDELSGAEDEALNESNGPDTVRRMSPCAGDQSSEKDIELQATSSKSSENIASVIENSIYCARVKELRAKINDELLELMGTLERSGMLFSSEPEEVVRMVKRSAEFCSRFNRIYMYQLQRQIHDIKRNNRQTLPFAKHTQFQSQMGRIVTLHQNLLQSFMVFHKSFCATCCVRESARALGSLLAAARDVTHMCLGVAPPRDFTGCLDLYKDDLLLTCDKVDEFVNVYALRCEEFLNRFEAESGANSRKTKKDTKITKKRPWTNLNKNPIKSGAETQLAMYSTDASRWNNTKHPPGNHKEGQLRSTSKLRLGAGTSSAYLNNKGQQPEKKTVGCRPLMRDPNAGRPRAPKRTRENEIRTMVEAVEAAETYASSPISCEDSPARPAPSPPSAPAPPAARPPSARASPAVRVDRASPVQFSLRVSDAQTAQKKRLPSPRQVKPSPRSNLPPLTKPRSLASTPRSPKPENPEELPSNKRNEPEPDDQEVIPVLMVKCAIKQDLNEEETTQESSKKNSPHKGPSKKQASADAPFLKLVYEYGECSTTVQEYVSPRSADMLSPTKILNRAMARENAQANLHKTADPKRLPELQRSIVVPNGNSPRVQQPAGQSPRQSNHESGAAGRTEMSRLLKQLCSGDGSGSSRTERVTGSRNVQLVHISGVSPRQPNTPQLLRILEETIKKKAPKPLFDPAQERSVDHYRLQFNIDEKMADALFQYRTKFVQHMLTSAMYANSVLGKPWEMIGYISEQIIDDVLLNCVSNMELREMIEELYKIETR